MKLADLQKALQGYLLGMAEAPENQFILPPLGSLDERFAIYKDAYYLRLIGVLKLNYGVLQKYLGVARFNQLMVHYLEQHPSQSYSIKWIGSALPLFLQQHYPEQVIWYELSQLEWQLEELLSAINTLPLSLTDLSALNTNEWPEFVLGLHPSLRFQNCFYDIPEHWNALKTENSSNIELTRRDKAVNYVLWRKGFDSYFRVLTVEEKFLFDLVAQKLTFSDLCERYKEAVANEYMEAQVINTLSGFIQNWIGEGVFITG